VTQSKPYRLHPEALLEIEAAHDWYLQRSMDASVEFLVEISAALEAIPQAPSRWPKFLHGTRRFLLDRFPFSIIYLDDPDFVSFVAVAHSRRRPGYWMTRL
jgi:toxin ParE1/3/4